MNDQAIEQEIQAKGKTAPRITPDDVEANIASEHYFTGADGVLGAYKNNNDVRVESYKGDWEVPRSIQAVGLLTFCVLVLRNGTKVVGVNYGAIDPARHDPEMGRTEALKAAIEQVWPLMGYELRTKLATATT